MFPNQDTLPKGGFGNLIALPLQKQAAKNGNSLFVDENFNPYSDQWIYLSNIRKVREVDLTDLLKKLNGEQIKENPTLFPIPKKLTVLLKNGLLIKEKDQLPSPLMKRFISGLYK